MTNAKEVTNCESNKNCTKKLWCSVDEEVEIRKMNGHIQPKQINCNKSNFSITLFLKSKIRTNYRRSAVTRNVTFRSLNPHLHLLPSCRHLTITPIPIKCHTITLDQSKFLEPTLVQ